uniref:Uncharacterized protein n=1 Tax=viral metagenome TaxID=1070528 RepID=A0A6C0E9W4_9ZZZZ
MENISIRTIINKIFEPHLYDITYKNKYIPHHYYITEKENNDFCFSITINENHIYISSISKCGKNTGSSLLSKIDELANSIENINYITLVDSSDIKIYDSNIDLAILKILTKGESWYNSLGFFSSNYKNEKDYNEKNIRNIPINNVFDLLAGPGELAKLATEYFPGIDINLPTKDYFNIIVPLINNYEQSKFLKELIDKISLIIKYDRILKKTIRYNNTNFENKNGGKKIKKRTRKIKKSNIKKRNNKTKGKK